MPTPTTSSPYASVSLTGSTFIDSLLSTAKWSSSTISYSIPVAGSSYWSTDAFSGYGASTSINEPWSAYYETFNAGEKDRFKAAMQQWAKVANLNFFETSDNAATAGDIRIAYTWLDSTDNFEAWAYIPNSTAQGGDIWFNAKSTSYHSSYAEGGHSFMTMLHELGHALGLKHPFEAESANPTTIDPSYDSMVYTLMSYSADPSKSDTYLSYYPTTPMVVDIEAIQHMYGKNTAYNSGDTVYNFQDGQTYLQTIWDGGGNNTISYTGSRAAYIDLHQGYGSYVGNDVFIQDNQGNDLYTVENVWIAFDTVIQNAIGGSGNDRLTANDSGNNLTGGAGNDVLIGGSGNDKFINLANHDAVHGGSGANTLQLTSLNSSQVFLTKLRDNAFFIRDGNDNMALVRDVQQVQLADKTVSLSSLSIRDNVDPLLIDIYVAAFRRAPEVSGYDYWAQQKTSKGLINVADTIFSLDIVKQIYPTSMSASQFVTAIYSNVFNRAPDTDGLSYWIQQLNSKSRGALVNDMTIAALNVPDGTNGKDFFQNRVDWAQYAVAYQKDKHVELTPDHLISLTNSVTSDQMTAITLIGNADTGIAI